MARGLPDPVGHLRRRRADDGPHPLWVEAQTNRAPKTGTLDAGGRTWVKYERDTKVQNSLVDDPQAAGELTTLITGTASFEEMAEFVEHLQPVTP